MQNTYSTVSDAGVKVDVSWDDDTSVSDIIEDIIEAIRGAVAAAIGWKVEEFCLVSIDRDEDGQPIYAHRAVRPWTGSLPAEPDTIK